MTDGHTFAWIANARIAFSWETLPWEALTRVAGGPGRLAADGLCWAARAPGRLAADGLSRAAGAPGRLAANWLCWTARAPGGTASYCINTFVSRVLFKFIFPFVHFRSIPLRVFVFVIRHYVTSSHLPVYGL